jgi:hypothetical protein|tara:strand:+ start:629 stop:799 length:171 start_codon:yes stop_codon:yes gene_type:complete
MDILKNITKGLTASDVEFVVDGYNETYGNAKSWFNYTDKKAHSVAFACAVDRAAKC